MKYEEAIKELEAIVSQIEKNELDIDQLTERLKDAKELVKLCKDKLYKTDEEIKAQKHLRVSEAEDDWEKERKKSFAKIRKQIIKDNQ